MSYRLSQLTPRTRIFPVQDEFSTNFPLSAEASQDTEFLRCWLERDADREEQSGQLNWDKISGLGVALAVSAAFWVGVVWFVNLIWK